MTSSSSSFSGPALLTIASVSLTLFLMCYGWVVVLPQLMENVERVNEHIVENRDVDEWSELLDGLGAAR